MKNYEEALTKLNDHVKEEKESVAVMTMFEYLGFLKYSKDSLLDSLSISKTSIGINNEYPHSHDVLEACLMNTAKSSLFVLSVMKNIEVETIMTNNACLFEKKNADYGNSFEDFALIGIVVRLNDKINRILNLGECEPENMKVDEKIEDTINDLYNYCVIGLMYT